MPVSSIIIKLQNGEIQFNDSISIPVENSNLPVDEINFRKIRDVFWQVEQVAFHKETKTLDVRIMDYFRRETKGFHDQNPKTTISAIFFTNLCDVAGLKNVLRYYSHGMPHLDRAMEEGYEELLLPASSPPEKHQKKNLLFRSYGEQEIIETQFDIWIKDAEFKMGYVAFDKNIPEIKQMVRFKVSNDFLLPEFELIKGYFIKALGTRKFDVEATIRLENGKAVESSATSLTIKKIDERLIDSIKNSRMDRITRAPFKGNVDKSLFTAEELFGEFGKDDKAGNVFNQSEEEMLRYILEKMKVRNRKQLEYLAGVKQAAGARLKFTLHPYFGFLFTVEGEKMMHFIWELLNSHATYIWSLDRGEEELHRQYRRVEDAINQVRNHGREQYKQAWRSSHIDQDLVFHVIHHEDAGSAFIDSFVKWRHRVGELMI